jgi:hypothetical protein
VSISRRTGAGGHTWPTTCSFNASPVPTPSVKRPPVRTALVAAACATTAGCMRVVGQLTAEVIGRSVTWLSAPIMDHANGA